MGERVVIAVEELLSHAKPTRITKSILSKDYENFLNKQNVSNYKKCLSALNKLDGIFPAYKLFYVGCSRAKERLDVYVLSEKISSFQDFFIEKMRNIGFKIEY